MDQLICIKAFLEIVEQGSLHKAAEKLFQTDAAISKKLSRLESSLNIKLLDRSRSGLQLTELGREYYQVCKEALTKMTELQQFSTRTMEVPRGELKISINRQNAQQYVLPKLGEFIERYPEILLNISIAERFPDFTQSEVDILFGIAMNMPEQLNLVQKRLGETRDILCATPAYLKKMGTPQKPADLLKLQYICHTHRRPLDLIRFHQGLELTVQPFLKFDDTQSIVLAALKNLGYLYTKEYMIRPQLESGELIEILPKYTEAKIPIYAYYRYQTYLDPKIRAFLDFF